MLLGSRVGGRVGALGFQSWLVAGLVLWGWLVAVRVGALGLVGGS